MARAEYVDLPTGRVARDPTTEVGRAVGLGRTRVDPWGDFSPGRWLWLLADVEALPEPAAIRGHQSFWRWNAHGG